MKEEIKVPAMGESVTEATIGTFLKPSGSAVVENDEIIELETEKVNQVLYAPTAGVITWSVSEGDTVQIGQLLGYVDTEAAPTVTAPAKKEKTPPPKEQKPTPPAGPSARLKEEAFVASLKEKRVPQKEERIKPSRPGESRRKMTKIRKTIAARLVESLHSAAMLTTFNEVDMSAVIALRTKHKESFQKKHGVKLGFMSFFVKAVTLALQEFPNFNCYLDGEDIIQREYYNIGIAVGGAERGLVVPVVNHCDTLSLAQIEQTIAELAIRAREGKLQIEDLQGGGFTITNGGVYGSLLSTPLLNPPQVGILGMHNIVKRPVVIEDEIVIRPMMYLAVSYDHRLIDGREAILFLMRIKEVLENPTMDDL